MSEPSMDEVMKQAMKAYQRVNPSDRRDVEFHMSRQTWDMLKRTMMTQQEIDSWSTLRWGAIEPIHSALLGQPIRIDDNLPYGIVQTVAETELERQVRRLGEKLTVVKSVYVPLPDIVPAPEPTLRALLRKWWKRVRRG